MATPNGFEPSISTVTGWRVRPLHYGAVTPDTVRGALIAVNRATSASRAADLHLLHIAGAELRRRVKGWCDADE